MKNKKRANVNVNDEESGKDSGPEVANQIKSSCNLNDDGSKKQSGKEGATNGSCEKDIGAETEDSEEMLIELMNVVIEIMSLEKIVTNPVPMKIMIMVGTVTRLIKEMTVMRGVIWRLVVMKDKNMMS